MTTSIYKDENRNNHKPVYVVRAPYDYPFTWHDDLFKCPQVATDVCVSARLNYREQNGGQQWDFQVLFFPSFEYYMEFENKGERRVYDNRGYEPLTDEEQQELQSLIEFDKLIDKELINENKNNCNRSTLEI